MDSALEQMAQFQWDAAVEILSQIPSDSTQAVAIAERIALCKREASLAPVLAEIESLQHSQKWLEAWSEYVSKVPINSYSLRKARQSFVPYRDLLADVLVREVEISALAGDLERARLATTLANRMNPTLNLPEPVLPTVEEIDPEQPQVERRTPASGGGPCGVSYLRGDLEAAISDCRRAGRKGEAASRLAALTEVQQGLLILRGMAGGSSDQQLQRALTALTRSRDLDPTRKSPLTRELAQACADLALSLGDAAAKGGRDSDLAAAINYWERGKMTRVRVSEFNSRLSRLDQTAGKSCYQPIYAAWSAGSLKVDKGTRDLERCLSITPTSGEYNQKSSNLLNELHR